MVRLEEHLIAVCIDKKWYEINMETDSIREILPEEATYANSQRAVDVWNE